MICKRCGVDVKPKKIKQGVFNNLYHCPECERKFGAPTILKKSLRVASFLLLLGGIGGEGDFDFDFDAES